VVRPDGRLIAGERRLAACKKLGWTSVPVTVVDLKEVIRGEFAENAFDSLIADHHGDLFGTTFGGTLGSVFEITGSGFGTHTAQSDGSGRTFITDPPPPANMVAVSHSQDAFVFATHLGENPVTNFNGHNDVLDPAHSEFANLAASGASFTGDSIIQSRIALLSQHIASAFASHGVGEDRPLIASTPEMDTTLVANPSGAHHIA
jgi:hypothetical protein